MNVWLYTTLASYVSQQKSKCGAFFSPTAGNCLEFHRIDRLPSALLRYSTRFSTGVFENLSIVYQHVLVVRINKKSSLNCNAANSFPVLFTTSNSEK